MEERDGGLAEGVEIRPARPEELMDVAELRAWMALELGDDWDRNHTGWRERFADYFKRKQADRQAQIFLCIVSGNQAGVIAASLVDDYHAYARGRVSGRINSVFVAPHFRRRGLGRALMLEAMNWLRERGAVVVRLHSSEEGQPLYRAMGFRPRREFEHPL